MNTDLDDEQDIIAFNNIKPISSPDPEKVTKGYREIVLGVADRAEQDMYLKLRDEKHTWNNLYLGRTRTFKKGQSEQHWNLVVPLIPRCYTTADRDPAMADHPRQGWIYIIRKCQTPDGQTVVELWRELRSDGQGNYSDVHLKYRRNQDQRPATGQWGFRIIVPYRINNTEQELWIAFSEVQWSWARIQQLKKNKELREKRMHKLELSDSLNYFANCVPAPAEHQDRTDSGSSRSKDVSGPALLHRLDLATDEQSRTLPEDFKDPIPVAYLDDPIGIARNLAARHQLHWEEMAEYLDELRQYPGQSILTKNYDPGRWFKAAALANRYFYSDISQVIPAGIAESEHDAYRQRLAKTEEKFAEYRNKLDKVAIEEALGRHHRQEIREKIKDARTALCDFLTHELQSPNAENLPSAQEPPLVQALDDYFTRPGLADNASYETVQAGGTDGQTERRKRWPLNYADGWAVVGHLLTALARHEYRLDRDLEARPEDGWTWRRNNPAFDLMLSLADPQGGYSLHKRLFPTQGGAHDLDYQQDSRPDDSSHFKAHNFTNIDRLLRRDDNILHGIEFFAHQFDDVMAMRDSQDSAYNTRVDRARSAMMRLVNGVLGLELAWEEVTIDEILRQQPEDAGHSQAWPLFKKAVSLTKGVLAVAKEADKNPTAAIRINTVQGNAERMRQLLSQVAENRQTKCSLAGLTGLIQTVNFIQAVNAFVDNKNKEKDWQLATRMIGSFFNLAEATTKAAKVFVPADPKSPSSMLKRRGYTMMKDSGKYFSRINLVFNLADMGFTAASLIENIQEGDDAAAADAMLLSGATLSAVAGVAQLSGASSVALLCGLSVSLPVLGLVSILVSLAGYLAKTFYFKEDDPIDIWLVNGPFARGEESHDHLHYRRASETISLYRNNGRQQPIGCTVHSYSNNKLYVDEDGLLVAVRNARVRGGVPALFQQQPDGSVWITPRASRGTVTQKKQIGQINQPFIMPPELQPSRESSDQPAAQQDSTPLRTDVTRCHAKGEKKLSRIETWFEVPRECYLALADALYRPRMTIKGQKYNHDGQLVCDIDLPYFIPGKSRLFIEIDESTATLGTRKSAASYNDPDKRLLTQEEISQLEIGPNRYRIERVVDRNSVRTLSVKARLSLYGTDDVVLPYEEKFDGTDVETESGQNKNHLKWLSVSETLSTIERTR